MSETAMETVNPPAANGTAPEAAAPQETQALSPQYAALAKKERSLRAEIQKFKSEREAWTNEQKQTTDKYKTDYVPKDRIKNEAIGVLIENGFSLDQIAKMTLEYNSNQDPRYSQLMARIDELEGKTKTIDSRISDDQTKAYEQALSQMRNEAKILIDSDPAYETVKTTGNVETIVQHIKRTYEEDGVLLSVEEAAKEVEDLLVEQALKLANVSKVKQRLQPTPEPVAQPTAKPSVQNAIKTLTHEMTSQSSAKPAMSDKDKRARAIMRAQGLDPDTGKPLGG